MIGLEPGSLFGGRYEVIKHLGAGGMGAVYLACDPRHRDFLVALKILYPGVIKTEETRVRFRNEIVASYRVNHRNIVRAYEYFDEAHYQAYAMEYVDGGDLLQRMQDGPLPIGLCIDVLKQVAEGLGAVHAEGICHRDLKPENILLTKKGVVKITDFGVARLKGAEGLTQAGAMVGTPKYVAPEYIETGESDHRGDIFALGVIAYEMLTGASPFREESRTALMVERFHNEVTPLIEQRPDCPARLVEIVEKAMKVRLSERYQNAEELVSDLSLIQEGAPVTLAIEKPKRSFDLPRKSERLSPLPMVEGDGPPRVGAERRRNGRRLSVVALFVALSLGVAIGIYSYFQANRRLDLSEIPLGLYGGRVTSLFADGSSEPLWIWRTKAGVFVLLGRTRCPVVQLADSGRFACGELQFEFIVQSVERKNAVGTIRDLGWGVTGTWTLGEEVE